MACKNFFRRSLPGYSGNIKLRLQLEMVTPQGSPMVLGSVAPEIRVGKQRKKRRRGDSVHYYEDDYFHQYIYNLFSNSDISPN